MKLRQLAILFIICLLTLSATANATAELHRYHTSLTRIDFNAKEKIFEISIQLFAHDLVPLLEKRGGKRLDLEKSSAADKLILDYVNENFVLTDKKGAVKNLKWIGKEFDIDTVEVYLQADSTENQEGYQLKNTFFFENFPEQTNLVICRYDGVKADLLFKAGDKTKEIAANKMPPEK